ncbi:DUF5641 domain-containing protein [Trichonephila clavipes]|nr:DUF5641 domain-containing protein [Trichonephila clavipes]
MAALVSEYTLEFFRLLNARGKKELIEWCMKEGLIASSYECPKCNEQIGLNERKSVVLDGFEWRCRKKGVNAHDVCRSIRKRIRGFPIEFTKSSYGACVFVRTVVENDVKVTLLRSKARVAPLKSLSIPRLELMSCCLGARLANSIIRALNLPGIKVIYWSDSEVALWWIREQGNWSVFVANRVKEIRELTQFQSWRHVPSNMNIADLLSRGCTPQQMLDSKWWEGPRWFKEV